MAIEDVLSGAKNAFIFYYAYLNTVAQEIGMERALGLHTKMLESMGAMQGKMMKEQAGIKEFDAKATWSLIKTVPESAGISFEVVEESPQRVVVKEGRCCLYEAGQMLGVDAKTIETMCRAGSARFLDTAAKQLNPNLSFRITKYRSAADDFCEWEVVRG